MHSPGMLCVQGRSVFQDLARVLQVSFPKTRIGSSFNSPLQIFTSLLVSQNVLFLHTFF